MVLQNKNNRSVLEKIDCNNRLGNKQMITIASDLTKYSKTSRHSTNSTEHTVVFVNKQANTHSRAPNAGIMWFTSDWLKK